MKFYARFLIVWIFNFILFYLANRYFRSFYVLGNAVMTPVVAATLSSFLLTVFMRFVKTLRSSVKMEKAGRVEMFLVYSIANAFGIWLLAKIAPASGFGIPAFYYAIYLGVVASVGQWLLRQIFKASKLN